MGPRLNGVLHVSRSWYVKGQFWGRKGAGPGHARMWPAVNIHKASQQGAAPVRCGCRLGRTRRGSHWRNLVNTIEPSVCGGDAALCQITSTTCFILQSLAKLAIFYPNVKHGRPIARRAEAEQLCLRFIHLVWRDRNCAKSWQATYK